MWNIELVLYPLNFSYTKIFEFPALSILSLDFYLAHEASKTNTFILSLRPIYWPTYLLPEDFVTPNVLALTPS